MQEGILPRDFPDPAKIGGLELFASLQPATEVSGDLYDFFPSPDGRLYFLVGDVSGKGVAAGLFMAVTRTLIRAIARQGLKPVEVLRIVNGELVPENSAMLFVTVILGLYDPATGLIEYAQGGHNQAVLIDSNGLATFQPPGGQPLGVFDNADFAELSCNLKPGEAFILYSDGVTEAMNSSRDCYSDQRLVTLLGDVIGQDSRAITKTILADVKKFVGGADQSDDITILALRRQANL
jgi:sigma-B regulation protein RsbU (phosphoserine phosphatase)